jgi:hypothetical protein
VKALQFSGGDEKPLFSNKYISKFKSCSNLSDLDKLAKRMKKEKYIIPFRSIVEFSKIEHIFKEKQFESNIVNILTKSLQKKLSITKARKYRRLIFKGKPLFLII